MTADDHCFDVRELPGPCNGTMLLRRNDPTSQLWSGDAVVRARWVFERFDHDVPSETLNASTSRVLAMELWR